MTTASLVPVLLICLGLSVAIVALAPRLRAWLPARRGEVEEV